MKLDTDPVRRLQAHADDTVASAAATGTGKGGWLRRVFQQPTLSQWLQRNQIIRHSDVPRAAEAVMVVDLDQEAVMDANVKALELLGYSHAELVALPLATIFCDESSEGGSSLSFVQFLLVEHTDWAQPTLWNLLNRQQQLLTCEIRRVALSIKLSRCVRISFIDVTSQLHSEQQQHRLEQEKLALLEFQQLQMNLMPVACLITDNQFRYTYWNPAAERMFGYRSEQVCGKTAYDTIIPAQESGVIEQRRQVLLQHGETRGVNINRTHDGQEIVCEWHNAALHNSLGETIGFLSMAVDVTQRTKTEVALRESEERYRRMVEHSVEGIGIVRNGLFVYVNQALVHLLRAAGTETLIERSLPSLFTPEYYDAIVAWLSKLDEQGKTPQVEERRLLRMDGEVVEVEMSGRRIHIEGASYTQVHMRDISARKWTEREILRMNAELEERVAERTVALSEANRELEAFSYSVAHDLRAPLRAISGFSNILVQDCMAQLTARAQDCLQRIAFNAEYMGELIEDLLHLSQIGRVETEIVDVDLHDMTLAVLESFRQEYPHSRVCVGPLPWVRGDYGLLRQLMVNLLSNALKFSAKKPHPKVDIGMRMCGQETQFFVRDNGAGFDKNYADKLFGVFQRLHNVSEFEGTGVGLAIVQRIVERHGGRVWAESEVNQGAVFYFVLPLAQTSS